VLDGYAGVWFYTANSAYYAGPVTKVQNEAPIGALEGHLSYDFKPHLWVSLDGNFWCGGIASLNGKAGQSWHEIGRAFGKEHSSICCLVLRHGGTAPGCRANRRG
jgi:hypothetical protein